MGKKKADKLAVQLSLWQEIIRSVGEKLGIEVDFEHPGRGLNGTPLLTQFSMAIEKLSAVPAQVVADHIELAKQVQAMKGQLADGEASGGTIQPQEQPAGNGTSIVPNRRDPLEDEDAVATYEAVGNELDMLREENGNLRLSLQEKTAALSDAHLVLNRITGASGLDRWTPDGQQVVDKINQLQQRAKTPARMSIWLATKARESLINLRRARELTASGLVEDGIASSIDTAIMLLTSGLEDTSATDALKVGVRVERARLFMQASKIIVRDLESEGVDVGTLPAHVRDAIISLEGL